MKTTGASYLGRGIAAPKTTRLNELAVSFVGAGGAFTAPGGKGETNLVLTYGDNRIAIDCGRQWPEAIGPALDLKRGDIGTFIVSHCHADHVGGVGTVAQMCRYLDGRKPGLVLPQPLEEQLWDETLSGGLGHDNGPDASLATYFEIARPRAIDERTCAVRVGGLDIELFRTRHAPDYAASWRDSMVSYGLYLPLFGVWISMDTRFDPELVMGYAARGAQWYLHDAHRKSGVHANVPELGTLPEDVRHSMVLKHTPDDFGQSEASGFADRLGLPSVASRGDVLLFTLVGAL